MKICGHGQPLPRAGIDFVDLEEITINATPAEVRAFAAFLAHVADEMERMGGDYGHLHLADVQDGFDASPHVTVFRPED